MCGNTKPIRISISVIWEELGRIKYVIRRYLFTGFYLLLMKNGGSIGIARKIFWVRDHHRVQDYKKRWEKETTSYANG